MNIFDVVIHFKETENWGKPSAMNGFILLLIDKIRELTGMVMIIHNGYATKGHTDKSQHYKGNAVDFHFDTDKPYTEQIQLMLSALRILQVEDRVGFGIYPQWDKKGFHLDCRGEYARWGYVNGEYVAFNEALRYV